MLKYREIDYEKACGYIAIFVIIAFIFFFCCLVKSCSHEMQEREQALHECFMQDDRTKECEYIIWQEEQRNIRQGCSQGKLATGVLIGATMSNSMRR